jgi:hypothetical protein
VRCTFIMLAHLLLQMLGGPACPVRQVCRFH